MKSKLAFVSAVFLGLSGIIYAATPSTQKWLVNADQGSGAVEFNAVGRPSALKIHGKGSAPRGSLSIENAIASGSLSFDLESLDTGIKMRNEHMKQKYLETGKYAQATLSFTQLPVPETLRSGDGKADAVPFQGTLTLHGMQKPIAGTAKLQRSGNHLSVDASFGLKVADYGISSPSFAGITMADDVNIVVQLSAPIVTKE